MTNPRPPWVRAGRSLWVGIGLTALLVLGLVFVLSGRSVERAEVRARQRAERVAATVLGSELSPRLVSADIVGAERRQLLAVVQRRILNEDRIARVRIWSPEGALLFSAPGDATSGSVPEDHLQFGQAARGVPASVVVEARDGTGPLLQTFVPLRVAGGSAPYAVAEIDQRYGAIDAEANQTWRPIQIGLVGALGVCVALFALSFFVGAQAAQGHGEARPTSDEGTTGDAQEPAPGLEPAAQGAEQPVRTVEVLSRPAPALAPDERRLYEAEERARAAEAAARRAEQRLAETERRLREATTTLVPPDIRARIEELETDLQTEVAERERSAAELQRLRSELEAKGAELALSNERAGATDAESARSAELVEMADRQVEIAQRRAWEAERRATEAAGRIATSEERILVLEAAVRQAKERATRAGGEAERAKRAAIEAERATLAASEAERATRDGKSRPTKELRAAQREANALKKRLAKVEASLSDATAKLAERERAAPGGGASNLEVALARAERDVAKAELARAEKELETMRAELEARISEPGARLPDELA
jgi:hypothetical protein